MARDMDRSYDRDYQNRGDRSWGSHSSDRDADRDIYSGGRYFYEGRTYASDRHGDVGGRDYGERGYGDRDRIDRDRIDRDRFEPGYTRYEGRGSDRGYNRYDTGERGRWGDAWNGYGYSPEEERRMRGEGAGYGRPSGGYDRTMDRSTRGSYRDRDEGWDYRDRDYGYSGYAGRTYTDRDMDRDRNAGRDYTSHGYASRDYDTRNYADARDDHSRTFGRREYGNENYGNYMGGDRRYGTQSRNWNEAGSRDWEHAGSRDWERAGSRDWNNTGSQMNRSGSFMNRSETYDRDTDYNRGPYQTNDRNWNEESGRDRRYDRENERGATPKRNHRAVPEY